MPDTRPDLDALRLLIARWEQTIATIEAQGEDDPTLAKTTRIQAASRRACVDDLRAALMEAIDGAPLPTRETR